MSYLLCFSVLESVTDDSLLSYDCDDIKISYPQKSGSLRVTHVNCRSLLSHKHDVLAMFVEAHLDILVLTEIWLDKTIEGSEMLPSRSGLLLL